MILPTIFIEEFTLNETKFSFIFRQNFVYNISDDFTVNRREKYLNTNIDFFEKFDRMNEMIEDMLVLRLLEKNGPTLKVVIDKFIIRNITKQWSYDGLGTRWFVEGSLSSKGMNCYNDLSIDFAKYL